MRSSSSRTSSNRYRACPVQVSLLFLSLLLLMFPSSITRVQAQQQQEVDALGSVSQASPLRVLRVRAGVLHAPPFATVEAVVPNKNDINNATTDTNNNNSMEYNFGGIQVDLLERLREFALEDNIDLQWDLKPTPTNQYSDSFDLASHDCYEVQKGDQRLCDQFDLIVANFYATPERSMRAELSPAYFRSTISTMKRKVLEQPGTVAGSTSSSSSSSTVSAATISSASTSLASSTIDVDITTMAQAALANASVCLKGGTFYAGVVQNKFPTIRYHWCDSQELCLQALLGTTAAAETDDAGDDVPIEPKCVLYASDELQLRHVAARDARLVVTRESFNTQYIVWALRGHPDDADTVANDSNNTSATTTPSFLPRSDRRWLYKWMYQAIVNETMDHLYVQYFQTKELCPVGTAGEQCDLPCDPNTGQANEEGQCICKSIRYTGDDCAMEIPPDLGLIPNNLKRMAYALVGLNGLVTLALAVWLAYWTVYAPRLKKQQQREQQQHPNGNSNTNSYHRLSFGIMQIQMSQPFFLGLILLGCFISTLTIVALAQEDDGDGPVRACQWIPWCYSVGFSVTFGTLFAKIRRVYLIFKSAATLQRKKVTFWETLTITGGVLLLDVTVLTVWTLTDPLHWERTVTATDQFGDIVASQGTCTCQHWQSWIGVISGMHLLLLAVACYFVYAARDIPTQFSEGPYVSSAMVSNLQIFVVGVPILIILGSSDALASFFVRTVIIWMNDFVVVVLIFGNLLYKVHFVGGRNGGEGNGDNDNRSETKPNAVISSAIRRFSSVQRERQGLRSHGSSYSNSRMGTFSTSWMHPEPPSRISEGQSGYSSTSEPVMAAVKQDHPQRQQSQQSHEDLSSAAAAVTSWDASHELSPAQDSPTQELTLENCSSNSHSSGCSVKPGCSSTGSAGNDTKSPGEHLSLPQSSETGNALSSAPPHQVVDDNGSDANKSTTSTSTPLPEASASVAVADTLASLPVSPLQDSSIIDDTTSTNV